VLATWICVLRFWDAPESERKRDEADHPGHGPDLPSPRCRLIRKLAGDQGIEIYAVAANNDFSSPVPEHRESQLLFVRELLRMSSELGAKVVRMFLAWPGVTLLPEGGGRYDIAQAIWKAEHKDFSAEQTWAWCREGMIEAAKLAGDFGITLALQNHPPVIDRGYMDMLRMIRERLLACLPWTIPRLIFQVFAPDLAPCARFKPTAFQAVSFELTSINRSSYIGFSSRSPRFDFLKANREDRKDREGRHPVLGSKEQPRKHRAGDILGGFSRSLDFQSYINLPALAGSGLAWPGSPALFVYSRLSATIGSILAARRAGIQAARAATVMRRVMMKQYVAGSDGLTP